ncbi:MAG: hypothetical protein L6Q76_32425, partial [Polyangiaceae bacterium]|nr:hypothetical protein [Polyangiaceae bacterium]
RGRAGRGLNLPRGVSADTVADTGTGTDTGTDTVADTGTGTVADAVAETDTVAGTVAVADTKQNQGLRPRWPGR